MLPLLLRQPPAQPHVRGVADAHLVDGQVLEEGLLVDAGSSLVLDHAARFRRESVHLEVERRIIGDVGRASRPHRSLRLGPQRLNCSS